MKTKETSKRQIYITVVTSGLTMLANKVARVLQPNEDIFDACSELANDIAKENGLEWSDVLVQYFNHYSDEIPVMALKVPSKPKSTRQQAIAWWNNLSPYDEQHSLREKYFGNERLTSSLTGREIEEIWKNEVQVKELSNAYHNEEYLEKPNQKQSAADEIIELVGEDNFKQIIKESSKRVNQK